MGKAREAQARRDAAAAALGPATSAAVMEMDVPAAVAAVEEAAAAGVAAEQVMGGGAVSNPNAQPNDIDRMELLDGKLFMSGIQDGLPGERDGVAWSVSINNPDGVMTIMVAGESIGVVGLGSCVTR